MLAFLIPLFKPWIPIMIVLWILSVLPLLNISCLKNNLKSNRFLLFFVLFYLWHILGVFYSENKNNAYFDLEVKLSFLLIPVFFILIPYNNSVYKQSLKAFVEGCVAAAILCFLHSLYAYYYTQQTSVFFYAELSYFHHPSYSSLYTMFALVIVAESFLDNKWLILNKYFTFFLLTLFIIFIVMLFSKIAVILTVFLLFYYLYRFYKAFGINKFKLLFIALLLFIGVGLVLKSEVISNRLEEFTKSISGKENSDDGGTSMRYAIWKASYSLITEKPLLGYGNGDTKEELLSYYNLHNIKFATLKKLNAHNQYLQTALSLGVFSALYLLAALLFFLRIAVKKNDKIYVLFILLIIMNLFVESMFETQAGVVFFIFVNSLLFWHLNNFSKS